MTSDLVFAPASPSEPEVSAVLLRHHTLMRAGSPEESCHVMDPAALRDAGVRLLAAHAGDKVLGVGGLVVIAPGHGELKSMHTLAEARGRGIGRGILLALLDLGRKIGLARVSLETGTAESFAAARGLYAAHGFTNCPPFGDYKVDPLSVFMTRTL